MKAVIIPSIDLEEGAYTSITKIKVQPKQEENKMHQMTENERKADWLCNQTYSTFYEKDRELRDKFNMDGIPSPDSPKDLVEYFRDGKYKFKKNFLNDDGSWREEGSTHWGRGLLTYFEWQDPNKLPDKTGYEAAYDKLEAAQAATINKIRILSPEQGLEAYDTFKATTFH